MVKTLPSTCGLTAVTASKFVNELDGAQVGRFWTDYYEKGFARGLGYLDRAAGPAPLHVHLKELSKAPMKTLERIYQHLGLSLSEGAKQQMEAYLEAHGLPDEKNYYDPTKVLEKRECGLHLDSANRI